MSDERGTNEFWAVVLGSGFAVNVGAATIAYQRGSWAVWYFGFLAVLLLLLFVHELNR